MQQLKNLQPAIHILRASSLALLFATSYPAWGQLNNFQTWSIDKGIPQSNVYAINQSDDGYLWVGTDGGGLAKFDGKKFQAFNTKSGLAGNTIRCILKDSKGNLWAGSDNGVTIYNGIEFQSLTLDDSLKGSSIISLMEDAEGRIWAGSDDAGINIIQKDGSNYKVIKNFYKPYLTSPTVFSLHQDKQKRVWVGTLYGGISLLNYSEDSIEVEYFRQGFEIPSENILCSEKDNNGNIWFGTYGNGLFKIETDKDKENWKIIQYPNSPKLNTGAVWDVLCRKNGEVWFATSEYGVIRMFPTKAGSDSIKYDLYSTNDGLPNNQILSLHEDEEGIVWIGTNGDGLCKFGGDRFSHFTEENGLASKQVFSIEQNQEGDYWLATDGGGLVKMYLTVNKPEFTTLTTKDGLPSDYLSAISLGKHTNKNLWIATTNKGIVKYNGETFTTYNEESHGLLDNRAYSIMVDKRGIVWAGVANGIIRYDGVKFIESTISSMKIEKEGVFCIIQDADTNIWFGTAGALARYNGGGSVTTFDEEEGLTNTYVTSLALGTRGNIWIGTKGSGIFMLNVNSSESLPITQVADAPQLNSGNINSLVFETDKVLLAGTDRGFNRIFLNDSLQVESVREYDKTDGFIGVECNDNAIFKDKDGNIWFGTVKGLTRYNPFADEFNILAPKVNITEAKLFFKEVDWKEWADTISPWNNLPVNLELPYHQNHLTFYFSGISMDNPYKVKYKFMLEGVDENWSPPGEENKMTYSGLSPGSYTFKVTAQNADGIWQKQPAEFSFTILPPWYRTIWFYIICGVLSILFFYGFVKFRERKLKKEKQVLEHKVALRTEEVVKQKEEIEEKNKEIVDSINYAKTLQDAILPKRDAITNALPNHFIYFRPKDIVSGDFYWFHRTKEKIFFVVADCTGHGVPGAFVSMVGNNLLNQIVIEKETTSPGKVLTMLNAGVKSIFLKEGALATANDGMDISFCMIDTKANTLSFAGAMNGLVMLRKDGMKELPADRKSIGGSTDNDFEFATQTVTIEEGDEIYLSTDGYPDQFGGDKGKKFKSKPFKDLLQSLYKTPMPQQEEKLHTTLQQWMGSYEQIDDICIMGVRLEPYS